MDATRGVLRNVETCASSPVAVRVVLAASTIAAHLARDQLPAATDLFVLSAAVVDGAKAADAHALELGAGTVGALLEEIPDSPAWRSCRGHLSAVREFAWLLQRTLAV